MRSIFAALVLAFVIAGTALAEDAVVIEGAASRDGLVPGSLFPSDETITLAAGERLHVLLRSGALVELSGPFRGKVSALTGGGDQDGGSLGTLAALVLGRHGTTGVLGAAREHAGLTLVEPDVWLIAAEASGVHCIDGTVRLWRRDASFETTVSVADRLGRDDSYLWPAGEQTLELPAALAEPGALVVTVGNATRRFELKAMPPERDLAEPGRLLVWFAEAGCVRQANLLLERLTGD